MSGADYLRGITGSESGEKTRKINVFDQTPRQIRCIERTHNYLGDGNLITEDELEVGKLYSYVGGSAESYGNMVYLDDLPSKYGYQSYLFEELVSYDEAVLFQAQKEWMISLLKKGEESIRKGRTIPAEEVEEELMSQIDSIENEEEKKYMGSRILYFIKHNPNSWEQKINERLIRTSHTGNLVCFKYSAGADFSDPLVCEARGIIIDIAHQMVVCWPFDKFFNVQEQNAADIDWKTARVLEKIDGSLIKLYWFNGKWVFATNSTCDAGEASVAGYKGITYRDVIFLADNYGKISFDDLNKGYTYLFELISPMTQVVIKYDKTTLYYLAARDTSTGEEVDFELENIKKPRSFPLKTIDECLEAVLKLNKDFEADLTEEGFVVVDGKHNRIKIKSPAYVARHWIVNNKVFGAKRMIGLFLQGVDLTKLAKDFPNEARIIKYYDWQFEEVRHKIVEMMGYARALYEEYDYDRHAVANEIKGTPYAWAGFAAIDNDKTPEDLMKTLSSSKMEKLIVEYSFD